MYLVINKWVTAVKVSNFSGHYLRNRSTLDIGVLGYIGILQHKEHSPEVWYIPPGTPCIHTHTHTHIHQLDLKVQTSSFVCPGAWGTWISALQHELQSLRRECYLAIIRYLLSDLRLQRCEGKRGDLTISAVNTALGHMVFSTPAFLVNRVRSFSAFMTYTLWPVPFQNEFWNYKSIAKPHI